LTYNRYRQHERVRLFEAGLVFSSAEKGIEQRPVIGGIIAGSVYPEQWALTNRELDFYDLKRDVEVLLRLSGALNSVEFKPVQHPALHPEQAAKVERSGVSWGFLGTLHPGLAVDLGLEGRVGVFELDLASVTEGVIPSFAPLSRFPMVRRDLSIVVKQEVTASLVFQCIAEHAPAELKDFQLFDLYQGKGIDPGEKSLALGLIFQGTSSTLIDKDVDVLVKGILSRLVQRLGGRLRD
jgi:phenylalanyl-tRNA synthetase beta chain